VLNKRIDIGEGLAQVEGQAELENAVPNQFGAGDVAPFEQKIKVVKKNG